MKWLVAVIVVGLLVALWMRPVKPVAPAGASVVDALSAPTEGFERVLKPRSFEFPRDAGPHDTFQTEWWYYTGNLEGDDGGHYGYQLTVFRRALTALPAIRTVDWAASQVYFAHFTVTDVKGKAFHFDERWSRAALGMAGARATADGFDAWVESWSMRSGHLQARSGDVAIDLQVTPSKPVALQGDHGVSHKSVDPTNASCYYSVTRLATRGTVTLGGRPITVHGESWLDREWSTSALSKDEVGWDWFSLQLADGRDVMLYRMRRKDGSVDPQSSGSVTSAAGTRPLALADFSVEPLGTWKSLRSGAVYPSGWRIRIPSEQLDLEVEPWLADQELGLSFVYWEGAVKIRGSVGGNGYVELTGYAEALH